QPIIPLRPTTSSPSSSPFVGWSSAGLSWKVCEEQPRHAAPYDLTCEDRHYGTKRKGGNGTVEKPKI
ncbi:Gamma-tubulin complex component 4, partial [Frankliniella fusca]